MNETPWSLSAPNIVPFDHQGALSVHALLITCRLAANIREAHRLIQQGAVFVDQRCLEDPEALVTLRDGMVVRVGHYRLAQLRKAD